MAKWSIRRRVGVSLLLVAGAGVILCGQPACLLVSTWWQDRPVPDDLAPGFVDDASRMNATHVAEVWDIPADPDEAQAQLQQLLRRARSAHLPIAIAGTRHSMGGHTIYPEGIALNMLPFKALRLDEGKRILRAGGEVRQIVTARTRHRCLGHR